MVDYIALVVQGTMGFFIGFLVGWALRKALKVALALIGLYLASTIIIANTLGWFTIHYDKIAESIMNFINYIIGKTSEISPEVVYGSAFTISGVLGFTAGILKNRIYSIRRRRYRYIASF